MELKITAIWSCTGLDTAELSFNLAKAEAEKGKTLAVELPCLGIPRLGFAADVVDRERSVEAVILKTEQKLPLQWDMIHPVSKELGVLSASVFSNPDSPVVSKVDLSTLVAFVQRVKEFAQAEKCRHLIFDCQGQITHPMTFFAVKYADCVVIPIGKTTDAAYILANVRRLVGTFHYPLEKFVLLAEGDPEAIRRIAAIKGEEGKPIENIKILSCGQTLFGRSSGKLEAIRPTKQGIPANPGGRRSFWSLSIGRQSSSSETTDRDSLPTEAMASCYPL